MVSRALVACWNVVETADVVGLDDDDDPWNELEPRLCNCPTRPEAACLGSKAEAMFRAEEATDSNVPAVPGCGVDSERDGSLPLPEEDCAGLST